MEKKIQKKYRYSGIKPYNRENSNLFCGRQDDIDALVEMIEIERFVVLHSEHGVGKTSLLQAGIAPYFENKPDMVFYEQIEKYKSAETKKPFEQILEHEAFNERTDFYLDKLIEKENSLWYHFKKLQLAEKKPRNIIIFFDAVENLFEFTEADIQYFKEQIYSLLYISVPQEFKNQFVIKENENHDFFSSTDEYLLNLPLNVKFVFSVRSDFLSQFDRLDDFLPGIRNTCYQLLPLSPEQAEEAILFPAKYTDNENLTHSFDFTDLALFHIIDFLTNKKRNAIAAYQLQIVCCYAEQIATNEKLQVVDIKDLGDLNLVLNDYYDEVISKITDAEQQIAARKFIEEHLVIDKDSILVESFERQIVRDYKLNPQTLKLLCDYYLLKPKRKETGTFYKLTNYTLIEPVINRKTLRLEEEENARLKEEFARYKKIQREKIRHYFIIISIISIIALVAVFFGLYALEQKREAEMQRNIAEQQRIIAEKTANEAQANLLAAYSFQQLEKNPTLAFRLAEKAYTKFPSSLSSNNAILNAFYATNTFYSIKYKLAENTLYAALTDDEEIVYSFSKDKNIYKILLQNNEGKETAIESKAKNIASITISKDKKMILTAEDKTAVIRDLRGEVIATCTQHAGNVLFADFNVENKKIITASTDHTVRIWNIDGKNILTLKGHSEAVHSAKFSANGKYAISTSSDKTARIWDMEGSQIHVIKVASDNESSYANIAYAEFSPDSKLILTVNNDFEFDHYSVSIWDMTGNQTAVCRGHSKRIEKALFSPCGKYIISFGNDNSVRMWDLQGNQLNVFKGHEANVRFANLSKDGKNLISTSDDKTIRYWDISHIFNNLYELNNINSVAFIPKTKSMLIADNTNNVTIVSQIGKVENTIAFPENITSAKISPQSDKVLAMNDKNLFVYDMAIKKLYTYKRGSGTLKTLSYSLDGSHIVTLVNDTLVEIWNNEGAKIGSFKENKTKINHIIFSNENSSLIAACKNKTVQIFDKTGKSKKTLAHPEEVIRTTISPDGNFLLTLCADNSVRLWDIFAEKEKLVFRNEKRINTLNFSNNGKFFMFAGEDKNARLFNLKGTEVMNFKHEGEILNVDFETEGKNIATISKIGKRTIIKIWIVNPREILRVMNHEKHFGDVWNFGENEAKFDFPL